MGVKVLYKFEIAPEMHNMPASVDVVTSVSASTCFRGLWSLQLVSAGPLAEWDECVSGGLDAE